MESNSKTEMSQTSNTVLGTEKNVKCKSKSTTQDNVINENTSSTDTSKDKLLTQEEMAKFLSEHIFNMQTSLSQQSGPIQLAKFDKNKRKDNEQSCIII